MPIQELKARIARLPTPRAGAVFEDDSGDICGICRGRARFRQHRRGKRPSCCRTTAEECDEFPPARARCYLRTPEIFLFGGANDAAALIVRLH